MAGMLSDKMSISLPKISASRLVTNPWNVLRNGFVNTSSIAITILNCKTLQIKFDPCCCSAIFPWRDQDGLILVVTETAKLCQQTFFMQIWMERGLMSANPAIRMEETVGMMMGNMIKS